MTSRAAGPRWVPGARRRSRGARASVSPVGEVEIVSGAPRFASGDIRRVVADACRRAGARRAVLFGSYARGTADAASDLDLLIVCETELPFVERFRLFREVLEAFPGAELVVYTASELEAMRSRGGFVEQVEREGIVLYEEAARPPADPSP